MVISKLTSKARTTIPLPARAALGLSEGDEIAYSIEQDRVVITRRATETTDNPFHAFGEWASEADQRAYTDL